MMLIELMVMIVVMIELTVMIGRLDRGATRRFIYVVSGKIVIGFLPGTRF